MKNKERLIYTQLKSIFIAFAFIISSCTTSDDTKTQNVIIIPEEPVMPENPSGNTNPLAPYANINFDNWKLTLPVDVDNNDSPDEYSVAQLSSFGYRTLTPLMPYMFDDTSDESIVFYAFPANSTANSSYSRTELREMINPTDSKVNWTLSQGGTIEGKLKMVSVTPDNSSSSYDFHRVIVMQIHGIIKQSDMAIHNFSSNNGLPLLKMYWIDGHIVAYKKSLVNSNTEGDALLTTSSSVWTDEKHDFGYVGYDPFTLKIIASTGKLEVILNETNKHLFQDVSLTKWPFENYFKAGNYLITTDANANATVKYYNLNVTH
ncbi:polysaccharide lyase family 7 protein [Flavobacterium tegetincola]|uniref:polysaccharide lyase family 7 protein n=1 Tax=Flavobacterium tegetincola TaxID=150172 RepID=UPI0003FC408F|nr:polysaccharide lyase family 7 protein [Flavobacterium tegetincola]